MGSMPMILYTIAGLLLGCGGMGCSPHLGKNLPHFRISVTKIESSKSDSHIISKPKYPFLWLVLLIIPNTQRERDKVIGVSVHIHIIGIYVTVSEKRAHFGYKMIFQYKRF